jgi:cytochrome c553
VARARSRQELDPHQVRFAQRLEQCLQFNKTPQETTMRAKRQLAAMLAGMAMVGGTLHAQDVPGGEETVRRAIHVCAACHGEGGRSQTRGIPSLAGQMPQYTIAQLKDFRSQTRAEAGTRAYMWGVSALLDEAAITGLANYYAAQTPHAAKPGPKLLVDRGRKFFADGAPARGIRACASCHGNEAEGAAGFPRLAGQRADYLYAQLKVFGTRLRPHGVVMQAETKAMTSSEMRAVAEYLQSL